MIRFWRFTLLTLLIALLPLRGWAWAVMPVATSGHAASAQAASTTVNATGSTALHSAHAPDATPPHHPVEHSAPCHATQSTANPDTSSSTGHAHTCSLCDLCHAGVIAPPSWAWFHDAPPVSPPSWAVSATHGRDGTDGLFRPPRA